MGKSGHDEVYAARMQNRSALAIAYAAVAIASMSACEKKVDLPLDEIKGRATVFEATLAQVKKLPASPPPVTSAFMAPGVRLSQSDSTADNPRDYLILHAEDLAAPPMYYDDKAVKAQLRGAGGLKSCIEQLHNLKDPKLQRVFKETLNWCTGFKHAVIVRTVSYVAPRVLKTDDETKGKTRTITEHFAPGSVTGEASVYDLANVSLIGAFRYTARSSEKPSLDGGPAGALERDLQKNARAAFEKAFLDARAAPKPATQ